MFRFLVGCLYNSFAKLQVEILLDEVKYFKLQIACLPRCMSTIVIDNYDLTAENVK